MRESVDELLREDGSRMRVAAPTVCAIDNQHAAASQHVVRRSRPDHASVPGLPAIGENVVWGSRIVRAHSVSDDGDNIVWGRAWSGGHEPPSVAAPVRPRTPLT